MALHSLRRKQESLKQMEKVLELDPNHSDALNFVAYSLAEEGRQLERALSMVNRALSVRAGDPYYIDTRGWIYYQMGDYQQALRDLRHAVDLAEDDTVILEHYADALIKLNQVEKAMQVYRLALDVSAEKEIDPETAEALERIRRKLKNIPAEQDARSATASSN